MPLVPADAFFIMKKSSINYLDYGFTYDEVCDFMDDICKVKKLRCDKKDVGNNVPSKEPERVVAKAAIIPNAKMPPVFVCQKFDFFGEAEKSILRMGGKPKAVVAKPIAADGERFDVHASNRDAVILSYNPDVVFGYDGSQDMRGAKYIVLKKGWFGEHYDGGTLTDDIVLEIEK